MPKQKFQPTPEQTALLRRSGSNNRAEAIAALCELAVALQVPLRQGVLSGDILDNIFSQVPLEPDASPEFPLDLLAPSTEKEFVAYTIPNHGRIPEKHVEGDYVMVPTYSVGCSIDWLTKYARSARWDVAGRAMQVLEASFVKKFNDDGFHCLLAACVDRNIVVYDADAAAGQFTKRLVSLGKTVMARNGGGNTSSLNRGVLTDLYMSIECLADVADWKVDQLDELSRHQVMMSAEGTLTRIFSVNLHGLVELGVGAEYQNYYTGDLSASLQASDTELLIGLDLSKSNSFVMPMKQEVSIEVDDSMTMRRQFRTGLFGTAEVGFGVLDNRNCIALSA